MRLNSLLLAPVLSLALSFAAAAESAQQAAVDQSFDAIRSSIQDLDFVEIIQIDHARLAAKEGVPMPPSRVQIFSDPAINAAIMGQNVRAGLDLPFRALSYDEGGELVVTYTSSEFLAQRHGLINQATLEHFDARINKVFEAVEGSNLAAAPTQGLENDFGIIELVSNYDVPETVARLKKVVSAQTDTIWFGEIDFQKEAAAAGIDLVPAQLLLFGGPAPGGVAMAEFPAIGLDAFCQKLLVYEGENGKAIVLFNDISALATLHYGRSIDPHAMLNQRLTQTFRGAIE